MRLFMKLFTGHLELLIRRYSKFLFKTFFSKATKRSAVIYISTFTLGLFLVTFRSYKVYLE